MVQQKELYIGFIRGDHEFNGIKHLISVDQGYIVSKNEIQLNDLPQLPSIEYELDPLTIRLLDKWWNEYFIVPPLKGMVVNHGDTCREMIANGLGYGAFLVPEFIAGVNGLYKMLMFTQDNKPLTRNTWMIANTDAYRIPLVKYFVDFCAATTKKITIPKSLILYLLRNKSTEKGHVRKGHKKVYS